MNKKVILAGLVGMVTVGVVTSLILKKDNNTDIGVNISIPTTDTTDTNVQEKIQTDQEKLVLSIDPYRCTGCGKCAMIDSQHFQLQNNLARIVSSENLDSHKISQAQKACKFLAINLL